MIFDVRFFSTGRFCINLTKNNPVYIADCRKFCEILQKNVTILGNCVIMLAGLLCPMTIP